MKQYEKLLYQANSGPAGFAMLFLIFNTIQTIFTLNNIDISIAGIWVAQVILFNIALSFLVFITASEIKRYNLHWSYAGLGIGIFQAIRYFLISPTIQGQSRIYIAAALFLGALILVSVSIWSIIQSKRYILALKE